MNERPPHATLPDWITDEQLLRDEAVLFGLSEASADEKLAAIRLAFATQTAPLEKQLEGSRATINETSQWLEMTRQELAARQQPLPLPQPPLVLIGLGIVGAVGLGAGLAVGLQPLLTNLPVLTIMLAATLAVSGCVSTLWLAIRQHRTRHMAYAQELATQTTAVRTLRLQVANWQTQKTTQSASLYADEARLAQLTATRDRLLRLFESEYQLARSVRDRVTNTYLYNE